MNALIKGIDSKNIFRNFLREKKKVTNFIKTFQT